MTADDQYKYGFSRTLGRVTFGDAISQVTLALKEQGFGVLAEIDIQKTLKAKINVDTPRHVILAACNPTLAHQAITAEPNIGLLLPCNVVVRENDAGDIIVSAINPKTMFELVDNPGIGDIADDVERRLLAALAAVAGKS